MRCFASCCSIVLPPCTPCECLLKSSRKRPENAPVIDRAMLIVAAIFRRHDGLTHGFRDLLGLQLDAILDKDAAEFLAIDVIKGRSEIKIVELA